MQSINYFQIYWLSFYLFAFLFLLKFLFKKFHWSFALAVSYTLLQTYGFSEWVELRDPYSMQFNYILKIHYQEAFAIILLCLFLITQIKPKEKYFAYVGAVNIVLTILLLPFHLFGNYQIMGLCVNPAMNAAITAITIPFLFYLPDGFIFPFLTLGFILVFYTKQLTPILALFAAFGLPVIINSKNKIRNITFAIAMAVFLFWCVRHNENVVDRMDNYKLFWNYWTHTFNPLIGSGNGSFNIWGPWAQKQAWPIKPKYWFYIWLHSDIYQTLFELGIIGLVLWSNAVVIAIYRMRKHEAVLSSMLAWLTVACFYYPLHFPVQLLLGVFLISFAIKK